jgi:8-oxo-dGTP diphosphatase
MDENLREAAQRELEEEAGIRGFYLEQIGAFGAPGRDPRERVVTVAYWAIISADSLDLVAGSDADDAQWMDLASLPETAFDHAEIINSGYGLLKQRLRTSSVALQFLPSEFTLTALQRVYEQILGEQIDKRNFRKWIGESNILTATGRKETGAKHRPAELYKAAHPNLATEASVLQTSENRPENGDRVADEAYRRGFRDGVESVVRSAKEILKTR